MTNRTTSTEMTSCFQSRNMQSKRISVVIAAETNTSESLLPHTSSTSSTLQHNSTSPHRRRRRQRQRHRRRSSSTSCCSDDHIDVVRCRQTPATIATNVVRSWMVHTRFVKRNRCKQSSPWSSSSLSSSSSSFVQLLLLLLGLAATCCALEPDFVVPLENVTIAQGRDATFTCVVNNLGGYRVAWIKADAKAILAIHEHVITNNDRLSVLHNDYNTWTLSIRNVRMEDRGQYMCQVNTDPMKMQTAHLEVVIPPDILYEETSGDMMVPEGSSAKLVCKARGYPMPKITWRREDGREIIARSGLQGKTKSLNIDGDTLVLHKVTRSEMGAYLCIASNGVPPSVSKRMKLQVHFHPLIQVPNQLVGAPVGTDVTLVCNVEASPKAINYWQRENGEMIISNERYVMTDTDNSMYAIQMVLVIRRLQKSDFGGYKCISKNSIGGIEATIRLYEMELTKKKSHRHRSHNDDDSTESTANLDDADSGTKDRNGHFYDGLQSNGGNAFVGRLSCHINTTLLNVIVLALFAMFAANRQKVDALGLKLSGSTFLSSL